MKEQLIELGFEKWLQSLYVAPYPVIFWDVPKFIQQAYIQKWLREVHKTDVNPNNSPNGKYDLWTNDGDLLNGAKEYNSYEEALEAGLQYALSLINLQ